MFHIFRTLIGQFFRNKKVKYDNKQLEGIDSGNYSVANLFKDWKQKHDKLTHVKHKY